MAPNCTSNGNLFFSLKVNLYIDGLVQEKSNSTALAKELHLSCTNP